MISVGTNFRLSFIERVFYDDTWNGRNPTEKFLEPLQTLIRLGESVTDSQLQQYKEAVRPEWVMHHLFTSVCAWRYFKREGKGGLLLARERDNEGK